MVEVLSPVGTHHPLGLTGLVTTTGTSQLCSSLLGDPGLPEPRRILEMEITP